MKKNWTAGLDNGYAEDVINAYKSSTILRRRLSELLQDKISESTKTAISKVTYNNPNWSYLQADNVGYIRAITEILGLIEEKDPN